MAVTPTPVQATAPTSMVGTAAPAPLPKTPTEETSDIGKEMFTGQPGDVKLGPDGKPIVSPMVDDLNEQGLTPAQLKAQADAKAAAEATAAAEAKAKAEAEAKAKLEAEEAAMTPEQRAAAQKARDDAAAAKKLEEEAAAKKKAEDAKKVPEKYEFQLPEDVKVDDKIMAKTQEVFKKLGVTQENAQELVNLNLEALQAMRSEGETRAYDLFKQTRAGWQQEIKEDPVFGGANLTQSLAYVAAARKAFTGTEEAAFIEAMELTGGGDHPVIFRTLARIGKAISNDTFVTGDGSRGPNLREQSAEEIMYPGMSGKAA